MTRMDTVLEGAARQENRAKMALINTWRERLNFMKNHMIENNLNVDYVIINEIMLIDLENFLGQYHMRRHYEDLKRRVSEFDFDNMSPQSDDILSFLLCLKCADLQKLVEYFGERSIIEVWMREYRIHETDMPELDDWEPPYPWMYDENGKIKEQESDLIDNAYIYIWEGEVLRSMGVERRQNNDDDDDE